MAARSLTQRGPADSNAGAKASGGSGVFDARPSLESPNAAALWFELECTKRPSEQRGEACSEQFEITLTRGSERSLIADLRVDIVLRGRSERQPPGTFQVRLEEVAP